MKSYCLALLLLLLHAVSAIAGEAVSVTIHKLAAERQGPWYAVVYGRMKEPGRVSGTMAAYEPSPQIAIEKAIKACKSRTDMAECELVVVSKDCLFVSVGSKDGGKEVRYTYGATEEESLRKCSEGGFQCAVKIKQGCES